MCNIQGMQKIKIACIGNYPPRQCGIATFTKNFIASMIKNEDEDVKADAYIVAMDDQNQSYTYPEEVKQIIRANHQRDYLKAAKYINYSDANVCFLQHEFGIFGGDSGIYILSLVNSLKIPLIAIFHTVSNEPSFSEKAVIREIGKAAEKIVVMSERAIAFLTEIYDIPRDKIEIIAHGVPAFDFVQHKKQKRHFHLENKKVLFTFGLLSRNKGLETVINALPEIVERHPEVIYIILGKTHPNVIKVSGEDYRNYLKLLVRRNNLRNFVYFDDRFVNTEELLGYLTAIDIYITPYLNENQITSGSLSYALGAGTAVVSTPYWHAQELLADERGRLFDFNDPKQLAEIVNELLDKPEELIKLRKHAYDFGQKMLWPSIGRQYLKLAADTVITYPAEKTREESIINPLVLPRFDLTHIKRLTDNTGIIQHARYNVPNFKEGYCLDDSARALLMCVMAYRQKKNRDALELLPVYLSYIHYMQNQDGTFRNFLSYNRNFLDQIGSEDSFGRTIWALGYLIRYSPQETYFQLGKEMLASAYPHYQHLTYLRGMANSIIGISHYLHHFPTDEGMNLTLRNLTKRLVDQYEAEKDKDWHWFESRLTYDNGILPLALFHAYEITNDERTLKAARESMEFLKNLFFKNNHVSLVGNKHWYEKNGSSHSQYAQQPINAMAKVLMFYQSYVVLKDKECLQKMFSAFMWFLGENDLRIPLYDFETFGCNDGLESEGVNRNQGAESILAYLIAHLVVLSAYEHDV